MKKLLLALACLCVTYNSNSSVGAETLKPVTLVTGASSSKPVGELIQKGLDYDRDPLKGDFKPDFLNKKWCITHWTTGVQLLLTEGQVGQRGRQIGEWIENTKALKVVLRDEPDKIHAVEQLVAAGVFPDRAVASWGLLASFAVGVQARYEKLGQPFVFPAAVLALLLAKGCDAVNPTKNSESGVLQQSFLAAIEAGNHPFKHEIIDAIQIHHQLSESDKSLKCAQLLAIQSQVIEDEHKQQRMPSVLIDACTQTDE